MSDILSEYQKWKQQGEDLRAQARQAMEARFRELLTEAAHLADEYRADFGGGLKPPPAITAFRYKASAHARKKTAKAKPAGKAPAPVEAPAAKANPKVAGLQKRLAAAKKKLEDAKTAGTATRVLEDRVYEIEDELRLAQA
jgi:hypothetical protein